MRKVGKLFREKRPALNAQQNILFAAAERWPLSKEKTMKIDDFTPDRVIKIMRVFLFFLGSLILILFIVGVINTLEKKEEKENEEEIRQSGKARTSHSLVLSSLPWE